MGGITASYAIASLALGLIVWRLGLLQTTFLMPLKIMRGVISPLGSSQNGVEPNSITGAIFNVTRDHVQMAQIFDDFLHSPGIRPEVKDHFRIFLSRQRIRSHPRLEATLDWLLQLYWIVLPIVAFFVFCNVGSRAVESEAAAQQTHTPDRSGTHRGNDHGAGSAATRIRPGKSGLSDKLSLVQRK